MPNYIVTGASGGIGRATVALLASLGNSVLAVDIVQPDYELDRVVAFEADAREEDHAVRMVEAAVRAFDTIDGMHVNAAILGPEPTPFWDVRAAEIEDVFKVNVVGSFLAIREALRYFMRSHRSGSIVVTGSIAASYGANRLVPYSASKHALLGLMRTAAVQGAPYGIRTNAISPSMTLTDMASTISARSGDAGKGLALFAQQVPLGRLAEPREIAQGVEFLLSDRSSYINGQNLAVDGGLAAENPLRPMWSTESDS